MIRTLRWQQQMNQLGTLNPGRYVICNTDLMQKEIEELRTEILEQSKTPIIEGPFRNRTEKMQEGSWQRHGSDHYQRFLEAVSFSHMLECENEELRKSIDLLMTTTK